MTKVELQHIAHLLVRAYKLCITDYLHTGKIKADTRFFAVPTQAQAPQTLAELRECYAKGVLPIAEEFSEHAIYGSRGNVIFRAWHDCGHLIFDTEMSASDEKDLAALQWIHISRFIPADMQTIVSYVYLADTWAQTHYCELTGRFPVRQDLFVQDIATALEQGTNISLAVEGYVAQERRKGSPTGRLEAWRPTPHNFDFVACDFAALEARGSLWWVERFGEKPALAAQFEPVPAETIREFAGAVLAHNESVRQYKATYSRLMLAASRFPRKPQFPYGKENFLCKS